MRIEAGILRQQLAQALDQQSGADQQHDRERDLTRHQDSPRAIPRPASGSRRRRCRAARNSDRDGTPAAPESARKPTPVSNRNRQREAEHRQIDAHRLEPGQPDPAGLLQQRYAPLREHRSQHRSRAREQHALRRAVGRSGRAGWLLWRRARRFRGPGRWRARASGSPRWRTRSAAPAPTAPVMISSVGRISLTMLSCNGVRSRWPPAPASVFEGCSCRYCWNRTAASAAACSAGDVRLQPRDHADIARHPAGSGPAAGPGTPPACWPTGRSREREMHTPPASRPPRCKPAGPAKWTCPRLPDRPQNAAATERG